MGWQIQARNRRHGTQWEPVTLEPAAILPDGSPERRFDYAKLEQALEALKHFLEANDALPMVVVRAATGVERFLDRYELRFACVTHTQPAEKMTALAPLYAYQAEIEEAREREAAERVLRENRA